MLTGKQQRQYLTKQNNAWQEHLQTFRDSRDPEALHQLRVTLKKLKAVARFSKDCAGTKAVRDFNGLKKMFKQAGVIRDAGNHLQLLERFHPASEEYKTQQQHLQTTETERFIQQIKKYRRQGKRAGRRLVGHVHSIPAHSIQDWYAVQIITTGILLTASGDDLHNARKQIKDMLYVEKLLPATVSADLNLNRPYLDDLQDAIGQWHDAVVVVSTWAGKDLEGSQAMVHACREKESAVRTLAADFYLSVHCAVPAPANP
jgi:CHAD domain-containing protein